MNENDSPEDAVSPPRDLHRERKIRAALAKMPVYELERLAYTEAADLTRSVSRSKRWRLSFRAILRRLRFWR